MGVVRQNDRLVLRSVCLNRTQGLMLGFFALAWASLAPEIYEQALQLPQAQAGACLI